MYHFEFMIHYTYNLLYTMYCPTSFSKRAFGLNKIQYFILISKNSYFIYIFSINNINNNLFNSVNSF